MPVKPWWRETLETILWALVLALILRAFVVQAFWIPSGSMIPTLDPHLPPHRVNYRAILWAAKAAGAVRVISTNSVGTMSWHPVRSFVIPIAFGEVTR